ncbi:MAG: glycine zipper 2TM domain-containing protein [Opitutales bacterium]|nr:glycine zipper 2TM domain-containing protein [Opitutales bacterium]
MKTLCRFAEKFLILFLVFSVAGCSSPKQTGALIGGVAGAVVGREMGASTGAAIGAGVGAVVGFAIGRHIEELRKQLDAERANYQREVQRWRQEEMRMRQAGNAIQADDARRRLTVSQMKLNAANAEIERIWKEINQLQRESDQNAAAQRELKRIRERGLLST